MRMLILVSILSLQIQPTMADTPLATSSNPVTADQINAYHPQTACAKDLWDKLSVTAKAQIYEVEHRYYFNPSDRKTNFEVIAIAAYDTQIRDQHLDNGLDEHSYITGFLDAAELAYTEKDKKQQPSPSSTHKVGMGMLHFVSRAVGGAAAAADPAAYAVQQGNSNIILSPYRGLSAAPTVPMQPLMQLPQPVFENVNVNGQPGTITGLGNMLNFHGPAFSNY